MRLDSAARVRALEPDQQALRALPKVGVVAADANADAGTAADSPADIEVRAFAASIGVPEDPVTGSLNAGLAQWLIAEGRVFIAQEAGTTWVGGHVVGCIEGCVML